MKRYKNLEEAFCRELERMDKQYAGDVMEVSEQDAKRADILFHALKSAESFYAMKEAEDWEEEDMERSGERSGERGRSGREGSGRSYLRGRDSMGRFASRGQGGYSGYDGYSGHYPEWMPPYYPQRF